MENTNNANESWQDKDQWRANAADENTQNLRDREDEDDEEDTDEEETPKTDWGSVDPQEHPGLPSDMDPSGPGSAV